MSSIFLFINNLYCWICNSYGIHKDLSKDLQKPDGSFTLFWNLKSLFSDSLHVAATGGHVLYHSLSFIATRCHLLYHTLSPVVTWCTTRLSFYKQSNWKQALKEWVTATALWKKKKNILNGRMDGFIWFYEKQYVWKNGWPLLLSSNKTKRDFKAWTEEWR